MKTRKVPEWLKEFRRRTALIDVIALAYESPCECEVCKRLREIGEDLGDLFMPRGK